MRLPWTPSPGAGGVRHYRIAQRAVRSAGRDRNSGMCTCLARAAPHRLQGWRSGILPDNLCFASAGRLIPAILYKYLPGTRVRPDPSEVPGKPHAKLPQRREPDLTKKQQRFRGGFP